MLNTKKSSLLFTLLVLLISDIALPRATKAQTYLQPGQTYRRTILEGQWTHFYVRAEDWDNTATFTVRSEGRSRRIRGNPDMYVRYGQQPTLTEYDFRPYVSRREETVTIDQTTSPQLESGLYYISIHARTKTTCSIWGSVDTVASVHDGMGARPYDDAAEAPDGTAFRVWAPFADSVHVAGAFNDWSSNAAAMISEANGHWSLDYRNALAGQRYKYVIRNGSQTLWRMDPREESVTNSTGDTVIFDDNFAWTDQQFQMAPWTELVLYEMHVGTLNDQPGGRPGTFDDAIARLDHIRDLGINAISVMPIGEFAGDFSWGYNPAHPFAVEEAYGGPAALKRFVDAAHSRGIAVMLDLVHNHWGPSDLGTWQFDGWSENGRGGIYFYQDDRANTQWGDTRPDFGRQEVRQYIRDNVLMWLLDFHLDGIRWDSVKYTANSDNGPLPDGWSLLQSINDEINVNQPWTLSIAEDLQNNEWVTKDTGAGGAGFDAQWDAGFVHPIRSAIIGSSDNDRNMWDVKDAIEHRYNTDAFERVIYTESHDEVANGRSRVPEEIWPGNADSWVSKKRSTIGAALVMTSPGIPMIFQGQDILEDGYFEDDDPIDWTKATTHAGISLLYRDLIRLRRNWNNSTRGLRGQHVNVFHVNNDAKFVAFHRWDQGGSGDDVIVVCNFRDTTYEDYRIGLPRGGLWKVRFNSDWNGYSPDFGNMFSHDVTADDEDRDGLQFSGSVKIAPYTVLIMSRD